MGDTFNSNDCAINDDPFTMANLDIYATYQPGTTPLPLEMGSNKRVSGDTFIQYQRQGKRSKTNETSECDDHHPVDEIFITIKDIDACDIYQQHTPPRLDATDIELNMTEIRRLFGSFSICSKTLFHNTTGVETPFTSMDIYTNDI